MLDAKSGGLLVRAARKIVTKIAKEKRAAHSAQWIDEAAERNMQRSGGEKLRMPRGVFVTIKRHSDGSLRGCVGFIRPTPLWDAVQRAAVFAAFGDSRFPPIGTNEPDDTVFEVSVMTEPVLVEGRSVAERREKIKIGRDGLIILNGGYSGLLLPQVPVEQCWAADEFLSNLCYKAGLPADALSDSGTELLKFECQVFAETEPKGKIVEVAPAKHAKHAK